jgi:hypothetical protein
MTRLRRRWIAAILALAGLTLAVAPTSSAAADDGLVSEQQGLDDALSLLDTSD